MRYIFLVLSMVALLGNVALGQTCTSKADGNWSSASTWNCTGGLSIPNTSTSVIIRAVDDVTVDVNNVTIASLSLLTSGANGGSIFIDSKSFYITGNVSISSKGDINLSDGAYFEVGGNLTYTNNGNINVEGTGSSSSVYIIGCVEKTGGGTDVTKVLTGSLTWCVGETALCPSGGSGSSTGTPGGCAILPVELVFFRTSHAEGKNLCEWQTATEFDNSHFEVQRSTDGRNFVLVGRVNGVGNTTDVQHYAFQDSETRAGITYYRLKQVDFSGAFAYSKIASVLVDVSVGKPTIFPNPITASQFTVAIPFGEITGVKVYSIVGQEVQATIEAGSAETNRTLYLNQPKGKYIVEVSTSTGIFRGTVVKLD